MCVTFCQISHLAFVGFREQILNVSIFKTNHIIQMQYPIIFLLSFIFISSKCDIFLPCYVVLSRSTRLPGNVSFISIWILSLDNSIKRQKSDVEMWNVSGRASAQSDQSIIPCGWTTGVSPLAGHYWARLESFTHIIYKTWICFSCLCF